MQINKHGSFYIRNGWPTKIIDAISQDSHIYSPNNELAAVDSIGVGRVMIKAMRYWAVVLGIATESKDQQGICHTLTHLGQLIAENDIYCTDKGSLWLLHRTWPEIVMRLQHGIGRLMILPIANLQKSRFPMRSIHFCRELVPIMPVALLKKSLIASKIHM